MIADDYDSIKKAVVAALDDHDLVVVNAGSSAGSEDYTARIVAELGEVIVHGIAIRPGHPCILGHAHGKPVVGIPGYPVSAMITFDLLVKPLLQQWMGQERRSPARRCRQRSPAKCSRRWVRTNTCG